MWTIRGFRSTTGRPLAASITCRHGVSALQQSENTHLHALHYRRHDAVLVPCRTAAVLPCCGAVIVVNQSTSGRLQSLVAREKKPKGTYQVYIVKYIHPPGTSILQRHEKQRTYVLRQGLSRCNLRVRTNYKKKGKFAFMKATQQTHVLHARGK